MILCIQFIGCTCRQNEILNCNAWSVFVDEFHIVHGGVGHAHWISNYINIAIVLFDNITHITLHVNVLNYGFINTVLLICVYANCCLMFTVSHVVWHGLFGFELVWVDVVAVPMLALTFWRFDVVWRWCCLIRLTPIINGLIWLMLAWFNCGLALPARDWRGGELLTNALKSGMSGSVVQNLHLSRQIVAKAVRKTKL